MAYSISMVVFNLGYEKAFHAEETKESPTIVYVTFDTLLLTGINILPLRWPVSLKGTDQLKKQFVGREGAMKWT